MKRGFVWASVLVLAAIGCKPGEPAVDGEATTTETTTTETTGQSVPEGVQLVKLNLPGMT